MDHAWMQFKLHKQSREMFQSYHRDGSLGQSALANYQRTALIQTQLRENFARTSTQPDIATTDR